MKQIKFKIFSHQNGDKEKEYIKRAAEFATLKLNKGRLISIGDGLARNIVWYWRKVTDD